MLDLFLQFPKALTLQSPNRPKCGALVAVSFFNLEGHLESSMEQVICLLADICDLFPGFLCVSLQKE